ncbi:MAG TPA: MmcQ/YjbR family DNA-binding protein [Gaiella sp.]|uniref:MmcQ/YjbR family DNA-binding protein n=1 Tax=Gaiella sp. TaxID=2663207 RepID=UPI002D7FC310|nr:MmcQ/YjbR family DNA-binding protein [Gaiella sp.]HET9286181.1 MmcQ/YjbR family DNA-binding protein [Gaiella sp.]
MADPRTKLRDLALGFPETHEAFPWDERVVKVRGKVFVFLGRRDGTDEPMITVKLVESHGHALSVEGARPTGYGLGKSGWVTVPVGEVPLAELRDWVEESYRIVAPKRLVATLDGGR